MLQRASLIFLNTKEERAPADLEVIDGALEELAHDAQVFLLVLFTLLKHVVDHVFVNINLRYQNTIECIRLMQ